MPGAWIQIVTNMPASCRLEAGEKNADLPLTLTENTLQYASSCACRDYAEVAQLVEHLTENQRVPSSSLGLGTQFSLDLTRLGYHMR